MNNLNPLEEEIMQLFWELEKAFPKEIIAYLKEPIPPYNTVLSTIRKLEKEGYLAFRRFGKSHQYYPLVKKVNIPDRFLKNCTTNTSIAIRQNCSPTSWKKKTWTPKTSKNYLSR